jgi:cytoskeletal protein RodZ
MLSLKTTIAALSVIATASAVSALIPQAFAQNTVNATQSNSFSASISQSINQNAGNDLIGNNDNDNDNDDRTDTTQTASQGFCLQANQQNSAAGNDATNNAANAIVANEGSAVDCS